MRVRLKGINSKQAARGRHDANVLVCMEGRTAAARRAGNAGVHRSYNEAVARKVAPPRGTLLSVLQQYQASEDFTGLADSTRRSYVA